MRNALGAWRILLLAAFGAPAAVANFLIPGIMTETIQLAPKKSEYLGFLQSALNDTEVEIRVRCKKQSDAEFDMQFVIRTSPCAKEFIVDRQRFSQVNNLLAFYFEEEYRIPKSYDYHEIMFYKSDMQHFSCARFNGDDLFMNANRNDVMHVHNVTSADQSLFEKPSLAERRRKRDVYPGLNRDTIDGGAKKTLTSWHPVQRLPIDAIYLLVLKITVTKFPDNDTSRPELETEVQWRSPNGYLSAIDYPLLNFYAGMWMFYAVLAGIWLVICLRHWRDLLRIQFWIGGVILVGMVEKAVFYAEYSNMNNTGRSVKGLLEFAELVSCLKRTIAHVLVIVVSVGFGVVKPRLGSTLNQVLAVGICYFLFCSIEGLSRVSTSTEALKESQVVKLPLAFLEVTIAWWIFFSLINTMRALRLRKNTVKLTLYRNFTNVLAISLMVATLYMTWSLYMHAVQYCMSNWKQLWIDTAFWHVFFCTILVAIVVLWRPSRNNQRYAFTPLLDDSEDENDDDELFNASQAGVYEMVKQRGGGSSGSAVEGGISADDLDSSSSYKKQRLQDDLKWIEHNIPTALVEELMDEDEERELRQFELSKML